MFSLEPEIERLRPILGDAVVRLLIARERREVFSIYPELRLCAWGGAVLLAAAAGVVLKNNLERIGPLALALMIGAAAAACYAIVWSRRARAGVADDYVLLLGALLVSADVAFVEAQFRLFGPQWHRHLLVLALLHGAGAYLFRSRMVLSLSIVALAGWIGIERRGIADAVDEPIEFAFRAAVCAVLLLVWRAADRRIAGAATPEFSPLFEHFAANLGLFAGVALMLEDDSRMAGALVTIAIATGVMAWGFRRRSESFVLYAFLYAVVAFDVLILDLLDAAGTLAEEMVMLVIATSMVAAIVALFVIHARFRRLRS